jgi:D-alanine-D-alanine ligase
VIPADLPAKVTEAALSGALKAHRALGCRGVSRSDFRYDDKADRLVILETNTQPGMTPTSLVPEQAAHLGISYPELVRWMIEDASCPR